MVDLRNFYFNSDYGVDTLVYKKLDSVSVAKHNSRSEAVTLVIPHNVTGMTPLMRGVWSKDGFQSNATPFGASDIIKQTDNGDFYRSNTWTSEVITAVYSDATNLYIYIYNVGNPFTMTYKVYGIHGGEDVDIAPNANIASAFLLNSDLNKLKVWKMGSGTLSIPSNGSKSDTIPHSLTYQPAFAAWTQVNGRWGEAGTEALPAASDAVTSAYVTTTDFVISGNTVGGSVNIPYKYRIYSDG